MRQVSGFKSSNVEKAIPNAESKLKSLLERLEASNIIVFVCEWFSLDAKKISNESRTYAFISCVKLFTIGKCQH